MVTCGDRMSALRADKTTPKNRAQHTNLISIEVDGKPGPEMWARQSLFKAIKITSRNNRIHWTLVVDATCMTQM